MYSSETKNYGLPQWQMGDHPSFINDFNPAFEKIDSTLAETAGQASGAQEQLGVLTPIVTSHSSTLESQAQSISTLQVGQINQEHTINDVKQNVAANGADITALQQEDHTIHQTADADRENFYKLLNWAKLVLPSVVSATTTLGTANLSGQMIINGNVIAGYIAFPAGTEIPVGTTALTLTFPNSEDIAATDVIGAPFAPNDSDNNIIGRLSRTNGVVVMDIVNMSTSPITLASDMRMRCIALVNRPSIKNAADAIGTIPPQPVNSIVESTSTEEEESND